jgi:UDP-N-acetylmuramate--alanine ligase
MKFLRLRRIHFVGAGGVGMSGLAEILLHYQPPLEISGCDQASSDNTERLSARGARIALGHDPAHAAEADLLVVSSAIDEENPEVRAARQRGIPVIRRAEMLAEIMRLKQGIAVAGTHGKTTTTSLAGFILTEAGFDPTIIVGGRVRYLGTNARLGAGDYLVAEADEYDRSFLELHPVIAVITNVEEDHLDCYRDIDDIKEAFLQFANRVAFYGAVVVCLDDPRVLDILPRIKRRVVTYGESPQADLRARDVRWERGAVRFTVLDAEAGALGEATLAIPGRHNVLNALAAAAVARELSIPFATVQSALAHFSGVIRRFETKGERGGAPIIDDYAHHPTEVAATLAAARQVYPDRRLVAVFQPHLFSRTRDFAREFGRALLAADVAILLDVYPSRERPVPGVTGELIVDAAREFGHRDARYRPTRAEAIEELERTVGRGDLVVTLGAGDVNRVGEEFLARESRK